MPKAEYLIVGQGIAGSILAYQMIQAGLDVLVIDEDQDETSSNRAAGIYNPITGRKMIKTWMAETLFAGLEESYQEMEQVVDAKFLYPKPIYRPFFSIEEQNDWEGRSADSTFVNFVTDIHFGSLGIPGILDSYGGLILKNSGYVDIPVLRQSTRLWLQAQGRFVTGQFNFDNVEKADQGFVWEDITFQKIIFCEGPKANKIWEYLPFNLVKGEILQIKTNLTEDLIINRGVFILPKNNLHHIGSTYDHNQLDYQATEIGINYLRRRLSNLYDGEYELVSSTAGVRPATDDRQPYLGNHPFLKNVMIFNGFGTKGVSQIPYFASQMVNYLTGNEPKILREVNIERVKIIK